MNSGIGILSRQILFASFFWSLFVLPGISPAEAYTESWTINGVCDKKATSGNCYHFSDITRNNAQAYMVSADI